MKYFILIIGIFCSVTMCYLIISSWITGQDMEGAEMLPLSIFGFVYCVGVLCGSILFFKRERR